MTIQQKQKSALISILTIFLVFTVALQPLNNTLDSGNRGVKNDSTQNLNVKSAAYEITITNANIASYSSAGTGAVDDPYIIKDLNISTLLTAALFFDAVSSYFILRDSYLKGSTYGLIMNTVASGRFVAINNTMIGNFAAGSTNGGYETFYNNTFIGKAGDFGNHLNATNNIFRATGKYTSLFYSSSIRNNILLKNNTFYGDFSSINLNGITDSIIENNVVYGASFTFGKDNAVDVFSNTFSNNIIDGKPLGLIFNRTDEVITNNEFGQLILVNSTNIAIENYVINNVETAIIVANSTNIVIKDSSFTSSVGIDVWETDDITIENCQFVEGGLNMETIDTTIVYNNHFSSPRNGIYASDITQMQISNNTISNSSESGIDLATSSNVSIIYNIISTFIRAEGDEMPISVDECENITIYYNIFLSIGNQTAYLAQDGSSTDIFWYNTTLLIGNYWSNWNGSGTYAIGGDGGEEDLFPFIDIDGDTLNETMEVLVYGTDPFNPDSDHDGLDDGAEINTYLTDPLDNDSDNDGLDDGAEINTYLTDPLDSDTDSDGLPDEYEVDNSLDPLVDDASEDADSDGLTNLEEFNLGTGPNTNDSDSDGLPDGYEVDNSLDPLVDDASEDADSDGLTNLEEYYLGTDPNESNTDGQTGNTGMVIALVILGVGVASIVSFVFYRVKRK